MSENFDELGELGDKIKKIIDTAVSTKDYRQMTEDIKQTVGQTVNSAVNSAVDSGSEAIKNGLNNVFGTGNSQSGDSGVYRNKTKEFEEKRSGIAVASRQAATETTAASIIAITGTATSCKASVFAAPTKIQQT